VGKALLRRGSPNPLYQRWIDTYGGEEFAAVVRAVLGLIDRIGPQFARADDARMHERFRTTSRYEWMFWEMGYRRERWSVGSQSYRPGVPPAARLLRLETHEQPTLRHLRRDLPARHCAQWTMGRGSRPSGTAQPLP
jgi:TENA/THI-4/PQQC family protein